MAGAPAGGGGTGGGGSGGSGGGGAGTGGASGPVADAGRIDGGGAADGPAAPAEGWMGYKGVKDLSQVDRTAGCGMPAGIGLNTWVQYETKVAIPPGHNGPGGDGTRRYFVKLPPSYDPAKVYKVVIGPSACVNQSTRPAGIDYSAATNPSGGVIQITPIVEPGVLQFGDYICYDDHDTASIEYPLLETMLKEVGEKFCYDRNKVFVQGHSSGGWYSNMIGCVYGSTLIRAMSSNAGGLANKAGEAPPCKETPTAGMWIHPTGDDEEPDATKRALDRALKLNRCEGGGAAGAWQTAPTEPYTLGGARNCRKYKCPAAFPVVFCEPPGDHAPVSWHPAAAWALFDALP
jgi:polyhydroxybutyrate depolymerase